MPAVRLLLATVVAVLAAVAAVPSGASAAAATPCWKRVIADWSKDGVISKHYSPQCLRQAMKNMPEDLKDYSPILDDINAALLDALGGGGRSNGPNNGGGSSGGGSGPGSGSGAGGGDSMGPNGNPNSQGTGSGKLVVPNAGTAASAPSHSRSLPLPLIVLGSVLLLGALAAASPPVYRRLRGWFPRLRAAFDSVRPQS